MSTAERVLLVTIVAAAAILRLGWNDLERFSPADESIYVQYAARLSSGGFLREYPALSRDWANDSSWWRYPSPLRWGHLALATLAVDLYGRPDPRALAWLSTLAGILVVALLFFVASALASTRTALLAAAFAAVSPIELALGRRALQDEVVCAAVLIAFAALLSRRTAAAVVALTVAIAVKETTLLLFPAIALFLALDERGVAPVRRRFLILLAPPALAWAALAVLMRDVRMPFRMATLVASSMSAPYVVQYQSGPPHRLLFDWFLTAPFVFVLACAAVVVLFTKMRADRRMLAVASFVVMAFACFSLLESKNLRFVAMLDPFVRLLAAWIVPQGAVALTATALANAAIELELFVAVFITGRVYDPVTQALLEALGAVPRDAPAAPAAMVWPWVCAAIAAGAWGGQMVIWRLRGPLLRRMTRSGDALV